MSDVWLTDPLKNSSVKIVVEFVSELVETTYS